MIDKHWVPTVDISMSLNALLNLVPAINNQMLELTTRIMEETENTLLINATVESLRSLSDVRNEIETTLFMCFEVTEQGE
jgi:ABC-type thiamine transport system ATPase subunit